MSPLFILCRAVPCHAAPCRVLPAQVAAAAVRPGVPISIIERVIDLTLLQLLVRGISGYHQRQ